ncbi:MAG: alpha-amylase family protein [Pseudomonadota bacterium]
MPKQEPENFRFRQVHLDFHTSEHIEGVGADFDPEQFVQVLKDGAVSSVTLFGRCHHGWAYYPTEVGKPHPHLSRPDLLGEMVRACREAGIETPIYMTVQWDELSAREHPEWRVMQAENRAANYPGTEASAMNQLTPTWHTLCLNHCEYVDHLIGMTREVCEAYAPPALFMDILGSYDCVCNSCLQSMSKKGLDPLVAADRKANDKAVLMAFFERFTREINGEFPDVRIFYNSGHIFKGQKERYQYYGQLELESLPTGGWGYDHFPASARYADGLGLPMLGMTGRFHTHWGEFGGFKRSEALIFECCQMIAMGAHCSIGDQLHPRGAMDPATYELIRPAYERVRQLEPYAVGAEYLADVALLSLESQEGGLAAHLGHRTSESDTAAARTMLEMQIPFDVIEGDADLSKYRLVVLPDDIRLDNDLAVRIEEYLAAGGAVLATGKSGLNADGNALMLDIGASLAPDAGFDPSYLRAGPDLDPDLPGSSIVMYEQPLGLRAHDADVLAAVRPSYFNRKWDRFCSHLHTPEDAMAKDIGPAILQKGRLVHCAYPLFRLYGATGQVLYKYLLRGMLNRVYCERLMGTDLPSAARLSLMNQSAEHRQILHVLYAPTQLRGAGMKYNDGQTRPVEIIEDAPEIDGATAWIKTDAAPAKVTCAYTGQEVRWTHDSEHGRLLLSIPRFHIHTALVIHAEQQKDSFR